MIDIKIESHYNEEQQLISDSFKICESFVKMEFVPAIIHRE